MYTAITSRAVAALQIFRFSTRSIPTFLPSWSLPRYPSHLLNPSLVLPLYFLWASLYFGIRSVQTFSLSRNLRYPLSTWSLYSRSQAQAFTPILHLYSLQHNLLNHSNPFNRLRVSQPFDDNSPSQKPSQYSLFQSPAPTRSIPVSPVSFSQPVHVQAA